MNQPSHILVSRLLHAIVFDIHHRDSARLAGDTERALGSRGHQEVILLEALKEADYQLDLDLMKKSYWQYHARETDGSTSTSRPETVRGAR